MYDREINGHLQNFAKRYSIMVQNEAIIFERKNRQIIQQCARFSLKIHRIFITKRLPN